MRHPFQTYLLRACALVAAVTLSACGGGGGSDAQPIAQSISFSAPASQAFGTPLALVATATSGLAVSFASTTPTVCTVSGTAASMITLGDCAITASQTGNGTYAAATSVTNSFAVAAGAQTTTFVSPGNQIIGTAPAALVSSATSGLAVSFVSSTPAVCAISGTTLTLVAVGTCTLDANQVGDANYAAATPVTNSFAVAVGAQTITFVSPGNQTLGTAPAVLMASATSGLDVSFASSTPAICTVNGTALTLVTAGNCKLAASQTGNANYLAAVTVTQSFSVANALLAQSIAFTSPASQTLGTPPAPLDATASSGLPVTFAPMTPAVCTTSGTTLTLVSAGTCTVTASQAGNSVYAAAAALMNSFMVVRATQTITFNSPANQTMGTPPALLAATTSSGLVVTFASSTSAVCAVSGTALMLVSAGTCTVTASQAGNNVYSAAAAVANTFTVVRAAQAISFASPSSQTLGAAPPALVATASSGLTVTLTSTIPDVCTVSGSTLSLVAAGTCSLDANQAGDGTYVPAATVTQSFSVVKAAQTTTFASPGNKTLGTAPSALVASASSGLTVSFTSGTLSTCTVSGSTLTLVALGTCTINASQAGNGSYLAASTVSRDIQVVAVPLTAQIITFNSPGNQTLGTAPPALVAMSDSNLPVRLASVTTGICTVSGSSPTFTLTLVAVGACTINADQAGNSTYSAAPQVQRSFTVAAAAPLTAQNITFTSPGIQTLGSPAQTLIASASSNLTVTFASTTTSTCTISGSTLTPVALGPCTITADQAGNSVFAAAARVSQMFAVVTLIADGGFEIAPGTGQFAQGWVGSNGVKAQWSTAEARTGTHSALLVVPDPGFNGSGLFQNAVDNGGLVPLDSIFWGTAPTLTFWAKGNASITGNVNYSLRYLDSVGNILNPVVNTSFGALINTNTWTKITRAGVVIPVNTAAVFLEMTLATGPTGVTVNPDNSVTDYGQAKVYIDDVQLFKP